MPPIASRFNLEKLMMSRGWLKLNINGKKNILTELTFNLTFLTRFKNFIKWL